MVADTAPKPFQVTPSIEYCQLPLPVTPVTAMPLIAPLSASAQLTEPRSALTALPDEMVFSSVPFKVTTLALVMVGASLTAVTVRDVPAVWLE